MKTCFLTGSTGVVGSAIAGRALAASDARLKLLIRAASKEELESRVEALAQYWGVARDALGDRVEAVRGDATEPRFGLSEADYDRLAGECTHVIHSAGAVRMNLPIADARRSAVGSAQEIIAFAERCRENGQFEKVEFISTVGVGGRLPGELPERWITEPRGFHNTYEQSKAEAEERVREAIDRGLAVTVHRPSMVVGDSETGKVIGFQVFYHLAEFISGRRTFGLMPDPGPTRLDLIPSDYVAAAILWSCARPEYAGQILHLCSGPHGAVGIRDLRTSVRTEFMAAGIALPRPLTVPAALFRAAIPLVRTFSSERQKRALGTLPTFLDYLAENQTFGNSASAKRLEAAGIPLPSARQFVPRVLRYYLEHGRRAR